MNDVCEDGPCDHCRPDDWHGCVRPAGHRGYHSCQPDARDELPADQERTGEES